MDLTTVPPGEQINIESFSDVENMAPVKDAIEQCKKLANHEDESLKAFMAVAKDDRGNALIFATETTLDKHIREIKNNRIYLEHQGFKVFTARASVPIILDYHNKADELLKRAAEGEDESHDARAFADASKGLEDIVKTACAQEAQDIHIKKIADIAYIRYRVEGRLTRPERRNGDTIKRIIAAALANRSEDFRRVFNEAEANSNTIDLEPIKFTDREGNERTRRLRLRVQKSPARNGFTVTIRLQDSGVVERPDLNTLGLDPDNEALLEEMFKLPVGIIIFSGPVGQGKTTTLVACNSIPLSQDKKIISLEDPIEIVQEGVDQVPCEVNNPVYGYPESIRRAMREDMDVLEIAEIRDRETAEAAVTASITGHLVASTTHANTAIGVPARLIDLGVPKRTLANPTVLKCLTGQRLLPKLCEHCRIEESAKSSKHQQSLPNSYSGPVIYRRNPKGCKHCSYKGEKGRVSVIEIIKLTNVDRAFIENEDWAGWEQHLKEMGWQSMADRAWVKAEKGLIDPVDAAQKVPNMLGGEQEAFSYSKHNQQVLEGRVSLKQIDGASGTKESVIQ